MDGAYTVEVKDEAIFVTFAPGTEVTPDVIKQAVKDELDLDGGLDRKDLWDIRGCKAGKGFSFESMRSLVKYIKQANNNDWKTRTAFLVDQRLAFGLLRMFLSISGRSASEISIFYDREQAYDFLGLPLE